LFKLGSSSQISCNYKSTVFNSNYLTYYNYPLQYKFNTPIFRASSSLNFTEVTESNYIDIARAATYEPTIINMYNESNEEESFDLAFQSERWKKYVGWRNAHFYKAPLNDKTKHVLAKLGITKPEPGFMGICLGFPMAFLPARNINDEVALDGFFKTMITRTH